MDMLFYCRSAYESDLLAELEEKLAQRGQYGFSKFQKNTALLKFTLPQLKVTNDLKNIQHYNKQVTKFDELIFARQKLWLLDELIFEQSDRIKTISEWLEQNFEQQKTAQGKALFTDLQVEYPDSEEGKTIAKFCKKFTVPLRSSLRKSGILSAKPHAKGPFLHFIFENSGTCLIAISLPNDRSEDHLGIHRLKMPSAAPSRSTLKLEEAINVFFNKAQAQPLFVEGMRAVDLGACPGGWSYQLVQRRLIVEAVDHGKMADSLMQTGLVEYYPQDGFTYQPQQGNVDWLVCDMIEQPTRVSQLMLDWLLKGKANAAIFNLKLPMNKRYKVVSPILFNMQQQLRERFGEIVINAKHLYHNRDEVTVVVIINSQLLQHYFSNQNQASSPS